jgi:hypothetical protein
MFLMKYLIPMYQKKRISLLVVAIIACVSLKAQLQTQVVGDSVLLHSNGGPAELILENSTRNVSGFLYNKWNGRTEFRKVMTKLNDSTYLFGEDTLRIKSGGGGSVNLTFRNGLRRVDNTVEWGNDTLNAYGPASLTRPTVFNQYGYPFQWITAGNQFHVTNTVYSPYNSTMALGNYTPLRISHNSQGFLYLENNFSYATSGWNGPTFGILWGNRHPGAQRFSYFGQAITSSIVIETLGNGAGGALDIPAFVFSIAGDTLAGRAATLVGTGPTRYGGYKLPTLMANYRFVIGGGGTPYGEGTAFPYTRFFANAENQPFVFRNLPWADPSSTDAVLTIDTDGNVRQRASASGGSGATMLSGSAVLDFPSTAGASSSDLTLSVSGAEDGDVVSLGTPHGATVPNSHYSAWVSASGVVTVRFNNYSASSLDPASATFKIKVIK